MTLAQQNKFNPKPFWRRITPLLSCVWLSILGSSPLAVADPVLAQPSVSEPALSPSGSAEQPAKKRLAPLKARLAKQYPDVQHLSINDYLTHYPDAVLVDVRAEEEYKVSRIPGAVHIEDRSALLAFARAHSDTQLILYCSVGARSAEAARFLQKEGQKEAQKEAQQEAQATDVRADPELKIGQVANLAGSIFEWANDKRPLENEAGPTTEVHPFNAWWGWRYLD